MLHTMSTGRLLRSFTHPTRLSILLLQLSPHGDIFVCGEEDSLVYKSDMHGLFWRCSAPPNAAQPDAVHVEHDTVHSSHAASRVADTHGSGGVVNITSMLLSRDASLLLTGDVTGHVAVLDARSLMVLRVLAPPGSDAVNATQHGGFIIRRMGAVLSMTLSPCSNFLVVGMQSGHVHVYTAATVFSSA